MGSIEQNKGAVSKLLAQVQEGTTKYLEYFSSLSLPEPSYEEGDHLDPMKPLPIEVQAARDLAVEAADELQHLLLGPMGLLLEAPGDQYYMVALQYIYRYQIHKHVPMSPPGAETTFEAIAAAANLPATDVARFMRIAISRHVFREPRKGVVTHTAASLHLAMNPMLEAWIVNIAEQFWTSVSRTVDATEKWPGSEEPNQSGYSLAHGTYENPFDLIKRDDAVHKRFVDAMSFSHMHSSFSVEHLLNGYDFSSAKTVVDVGGSQGAVAIALAKRFPTIEQIIVQDLPDTVSGLEASLPTDLKPKIKGMPHDFLTPQPYKGADIYLFRWILHDWSDKYCVQILRSLIPALKKGAKVLVNDVCIPEPGQLSVKADRVLRFMDISMKAFNNARERDAEDWVRLFARADVRFRFVGITVPQGARMAIIQAEWVGEDA
ncbi:S-adenosyl-L-methionine-dependent methyltransferase [Rhypophila sp. PSN 637]